MAAVSLGEAMAMVLEQLRSGEPVQITKYVTSDMVDYYVDNGWVIAKREGRTVVLVWPKDTQPQ